MRGDLAVGAVVLLQILVPLVAFFGTQPSRFGFQMYSGQGSTEVMIWTRSGGVVDFDPEAVLAGNLRPEFDWTAGLPERICATHPDAYTVTVRQPEHRRTVRCG